jgi:hypothetical protein
MDYDRESPRTEHWPSPMTFEEPVWKRTDAIDVVYERQQYVEGPGGYRMPRAFEALVHKADLPLCQLSIELDPASGWACRRIVLADERELKTGDLRVMKLRELVKEATELVGVRPAETDPADFDPADFVRALEGAGRPEPGKRLPDEWLQRVAEVYREALSRDLPATDTVWQAFDISRSTAGRWIVEARRRGFLGPAIPGRAGEQQPPGRKEK